MILITWVKHNQAQIIVGIITSGHNSGWIRALYCISAPVGLIRTGRDHGNEMKDEKAIQLRLDWELNPGPSGWKPRALPLS